MTCRECLVALMLAGFSAMSMAQIGGPGLNCEGLAGSAMAQCLRGIGSGSGAGISASEMFRLDSRKTAGSEGTGGDARAGVTDSIRSFLSGWGGEGTSLKCEGLVGSAMAQCLQGIGSSSGRAASEAPRQDERPPAVSQSARAGATGGVVGSVRNFFNSFSLDFGSSSSSSSSSSSDYVGPRCQGLAGSAMAQCLQGIGSAPTRSSSASPR